MAQDKLSFIYMKMTDDETAKFYLDFEFKSMQISFETKPLCSRSADEALCFEADITDELRSWLKLFHLEINEDESKIQLTFHQDGTMGYGLYSLRYIYVLYLILFWTVGYYWFFVNDTERLVNLFILLNICKEFGKFGESSNWIEGSLIQCDETKKSIINDSELTTNQNVSTNKLV